MVVRLRQIGLQGDGAIQTYFNEGTNQEMVYQTGGGNVDSPTGGVKINMIPKEGGNRFAGSLKEAVYAVNPKRASVFWTSAAPWRS